MPRCQRASDLLRPSCLGGLEKGVNHGDWKAFQMREEKDCLAEAIGLVAGETLEKWARPDLEGAC